MTRIASKFGIAAALTLGMFATAAAQRTPPRNPPRTTTPTTTIKVDKGEVMAKVETLTVYRRDTLTVYRRDTLTLTGPTVTRWDTVTVMEMPGWLTRGNGGYFGLGAGPYYPSAGIGQSQIPGYAFQMNLGYDPAGSPFGVRLTALLGRPDEKHAAGAPNGARPTMMNLTGDVKLRLPFFSSSRFPQFGTYAVAGLAYIKHTGLVQQQTKPNILIIDDGDTFGYNFGGGATLGIGHKRDLFLEFRAINFNRSGFEGAHQIPVILGVNWY